MPDSDPHAGARLWLPPLALAGCLRAALLRDTRPTRPPINGPARPDAPPRPACDNYWPASPYVTLYLFDPPQGEWLASPGFLPPHDDFVLRPCMVGGPYAGPVHTRHAGAVRGLMLSFLPDAFAALSGLAPETLRNRCVDATAQLDAGWQAWLAQLAALPEDAQRLRAVEDFLLPRWQALAIARPLGRRFGDWLDALALRAATSQAGRSLRQVERRVKAWAGLPMRELRGASRAENAFLQVAATQHQPDFDWTGVALDNGYADQSHLCRETRRLTGFSPEELRRRIEHDPAFWAYRVWR